MTRSSPTTSTLQSGTLPTLGITEKGLNMERSTVAFPEGLMLETTSLCNSQCITCPHGKISRPAIMDMLDFERLLNECVGQGVGQVCLAFYGEPLLDPLLVSRVVKVRKISGPGVHIGFPTNGSLMTPSKARELLSAGLDNVLFSVDGASESSYEEVRRGLKYAGVVANIRSFVEINNSLGRPCKVRVHMTATRQTLREVGDFRGAWLQVDGVDAVSWLPCDGRGGEGMEPALGDGSISDPCAQPFTTASILTDGTAAMCCIDYEASVSLGNVFRDGIEKVWTSKEYERIRRLHNEGRKREIPLCAKCKTHY